MNEDKVFRGFGTTLYIDTRVWQTWQQNRQVTSESAEACGVLIGSCHHSDKSNRIECVTTPGRQDIRSRIHFIMKDPCHQETVNHMFQDSDGFLGYLGTWHTHPENDPSPSSLDLHDWLMCTARNLDRLLYFVIVGTNQVRVFLNKGGRIKPLDEIRNQTHE